MGRYEQSHAREQNLFTHTLPPPPFTCLKQASTRLGGNMFLQKTEQRKTGISSRAFGWGPRRLGQLLFLQKVAKQLSLTSKSCSPGHLVGWGVTLMEGKAQGRAEPRPKRLEAKLVSPAPGHHLAHREGLAE